MRAPGTRAWRTFVLRPSNTGLAAPAYTPAWRRTLPGDHLAARRSARGRGMLPEPTTPKKGEAEGRRCRPLGSRDSATASRTVGWYRRAARLGRPAEHPGP